MLDRQHLNIIREVVRVGSVTAAADRLNLSQSAISHAISKLEERHGVAIWKKRGRSLRLTQAGEHLLRLAERFLPELEHAEQVMADIARGRRGRLRIGMECHPCERWLMRVTAPYIAAWPDVDLELRNAFRFDGVSALQAFEIDLLVTPDPVSAPDLHFRPVFDYELMLAVQDGHALADRPFLRPEDLVEEELLTVPVGVERLDIYTRFLIPADCRPRRRTTIETIDLMLQLVAAGRGVAVLPDWLLRDREAGLVALRIGAEGLHKSVNIGLRQPDLRTAYVEGFLDIARQVDLRAMP